MAEYKLVYFDLKGRGELLRLLFTFAGVEFEDVRFPREKMPEFKPLTPFGQVPYLEFGGEKYAQSIAIANYLAREFNLYGKDNLEAFKIDEVVGLCQDFFQCLVRIVRADPDQQDQEKQKVKTEDAPKFSQFFETLLQKSGTGYFVGKGVTLADIAVFDVLHHMITIDADALKEYPLVDANRQKVASQNKIAAYIKARKASPN